MIIISVTLLCVLLSNQWSRSPLNAVYTPGKEVIVIWYYGYDYHTTYINLWHWWWINAGSILGDFVLFAFVDQDVQENFRLSLQAASLMLAKMFFFFLQMTMDSDDNWNDDVDDELEANYWVDNNTLIATAVPMAVDWKLIQNKQKILGKTNQIQKPNLQETLMTNKYSNTKR